MALRPNKTVTRAAAVTLFQVLFLFSAVKGNDTGGIIPWKPGADEYALELAGSHCLRYGKYAQITSVHPWPGDYIGFVCKRARTLGPGL